MEATLSVREQDHDDDDQEEGDQAHPDIHVSALEPRLDMGRLLGEALQLGVLQRIHGGLGPPQVEALAFGQGADVIALQQSLDPIAVGSR